MMKVTKRDWITAAVQQLAKYGVDQVKVEVLAKQMKVSKGSFYWHFKNRPDLLNTVFDYWEKETNQLINIANQAETPADRLKRLFESIGQLANEFGGYAIDTAIFNWARHDAQIKERVDRVEHNRIDFVANLLEADGRPPEKARFQAEVVYLALLGYIDRSNRDPALRTEETFQQFSTYLIERLAQG
ncbi:MAG: TetR/AcrR family transcriptional regulator [Chloroflexota bacterium]